MARRTRKKSPTKSAVLPGQLGLFDAIEAPLKARPPAAAKPMKRAPRAVAKPAAATKPERPVVLNTREAAQYLGVAASTMKHWRAHDIGPKWIKLGARLVGYRLADLEQFLEDNSKNG
jgi:predicted DNA-binding transcriptional regulator AlpA